MGGTRPASGNLSSRDEDHRRGHQMTKSHRESIMERLSGLLNTLQRSLNHVIVQNYRFDYLCFSPRCTRPNLALPTNGSILASISDMASTRG